MTQVQQAPVDLLSGNDSGFIVTAVRAALERSFPGFGPNIEISSQTFYAPWRGSRVPERGIGELCSLWLQPVQTLQHDRELFYILPHILTIPAESIYKGNWLLLWKAMAAHPVLKTSVEHGDDTPHERLDSFHVDPSELVEQELQSASIVSTATPTPEPEKAALINRAPIVEETKPGPTIAPAAAKPKSVPQTAPKIVPQDSVPPPKAFKIADAPLRQQPLPLGQQQSPRPAVAAIPVIEEKIIPLSDRSIFDEGREAAYRPKARIVSTSTSSISGGFLLTTNELFKKTSGLCTYTKNFRGIEMRCSRPIDEDSIDRRCKAHPDVS